MQADTETPRNGERRSDAASDDIGSQTLDAALDELRAEVRGAMTALRRSAVLSRGALELALFDKAFHFGAVVAGMLVATSMTITAAVLTVLGVRRALSVASGGAWWVELVVAAGILSATAVSAWAYHRWMHGAIRSATRARLPATGADGSEPERPS